LNCTWLECMSKVFFLSLLFIGKFENWLSNHMPNMQTTWLKYKIGGLDFKGWTWIHGNLFCGRSCSVFCPSSPLTLILLVAWLNGWEVELLSPTASLCIPSPISKLKKSVMLTVIFILIGLNFVWVGLRCGIEEPSYATSAIFFWNLFYGAQLWRFSQKPSHSYLTYFCWKLLLFF